VGAAEAKAMLEAFSEIANTLNPSQRQVYDLMADEARNKDDNVPAVRTGVLREFTKRTDGVLEKRSKDAEKRAKAAQKEARELHKQLTTGATDIGSMFAGKTTWTAEVSPDVKASLAEGRFGEGVQRLSKTATDSNIRTLAQKLAARVENVRSQLVSAATMNRIRATMSPETPTLGVETPAGVYVHPMSPEAIAAMRREGHEDAASIVEEFGGQILFNESTPLAPELVMHEAVHAVGDQVLTNKSHPLTRQLDKLRIELLKFMPATNYGLSNVREFFAEGMTNPAFRQQLSYANVEGKPYSAWDSFKNIVRNWMRGLMGRQPIKPDTALTTLDRALDAVLAVNPNEMGMSDIANVSFAPGKAADVVKNAFKRARVPTKADLAVMRNVMQNARIPVEWKDVLLRTAVPTRLCCRLGSAISTQRTQSARDHGTAAGRTARYRSPSGQNHRRYGRGSGEIRQKPDLDRRF
jgi:hypothetical protein